MKKSCTACRALDDTLSDVCTLGFMTEPKTHFSYNVIEWKPCEECPKPMGYEKLIILSDLKQSGHSKEQMIQAMN